MRALLERLLPRLFPNLEFLCVHHEGKQDLEKSVPRKLRAWREPGVHFVVVRDNDGGDCARTKLRLLDLCAQRERQRFLVRIACQEVEAWYLGEPDALAEAFNDDGLRRIGRRARYRNPDAVIQPARELSKLVPAFQKVSGARRMALRLSRERNQSPSFHALVDGVERIWEKLSRET